MFNPKRFLLLGSIGVFLLAGLMVTAYPTVSRPAFASGCNTVAEGAIVGEPTWTNTCTVSEGNSSNAVYAIQLTINTSGLKDPQTGNRCTVGTVDGDFGQNTFNGVECFQKAWNAERVPNSLSVDGIVGPQTWGALSSSIYGNNEITTGWNYYQYSHSSAGPDFRMWGQSPYKWYVYGGGCWRQMAVNSTACE